jgi:hypothetical protein
MLLNPDQVIRINNLLRVTKPFGDLPVMNRPMSVVWAALDQTLDLMRLPLYHQRLRKPQPAEKAYEAAIQKALALLGAFAVAFEVNQAIVRSSRRWIDSISFQPRPEGMNWTAKHAIAPADLVHHANSQHAYDVALEDFLFLAAKVTYVISRRPAGALPDTVATYAFRLFGDVPAVEGVVRELSPNVSPRYVTLMLANGLALS